MKHARIRFAGQDHARQRQYNQQHDQEHSFHDITWATAQSSHIFSGFSPNCAVR